VQQADQAHEKMLNVEGAWAQRAEADLPTRRLAEDIERNLALGLEATPSINDRSITTYVRGELAHFAGETGTFLKCPFMDDVHQVHDAEVAIIGAPLDTGTTYRPGTRFGPQGIRRATNLFGTYSYEYGVDLREKLNLVDRGDIFTIPANLEKSFDQISRGMSHVVQHGAFPVVLGGDHSIGYPTVRGLTPWVDGNVGIIHFDRHVDTQDHDLDERMHTTPWFHATNIPNAPPTNLVQIGIGGWQAPRACVKVGRERGTTIVTIGDVESIGVEKVAKMASSWPGRAPGRSTCRSTLMSSTLASCPARAGPNQAACCRVKLYDSPTRVRARVGGMEVVECSPPYDHAEQTSILSARVVLDCLAAQIRSAKLGRRAATLARRARGPQPA
jgi:agmatinase